MLTKYAAKGVHNKCAQLIMSEPKGTVLDLGSGEGAFVERISNYHQVTATGLQNNAYKSFKLNNEYFEVDLNKEFDLKRQFDYATCIEVIEHLENPWKLYRDIFNHLKPNGKAIITTPNIETISSRIRFLRNANFDGFGNFDVPFEHINPISFEEMFAIIKRTGFEIELITTNRNQPYINNHPDYKMRLLSLSTFFVNPLCRFRWKEQKVLKKGEIAIYKIKKIVCVLS